MGEIDNFRTSDARKEILGSPREAGYLVRKDRPTDQQEVILEDQAVECDRYIIDEQTAAQLGYL